MAQEDYRKALRLGQKEFRSSVLKGTYPYLQALDEIRSTPRWNIQNRSAL